MKFQYQALQRDGRLVAGFVEAASERGAHRDLLKRGMQPTAIGPATLPTSAAAPGRRPATHRDHTYVLKQLHTLIAGGVPIAEAVAALAEASGQPAVASSFAELHASLRRGEPFSPSFARCFPGIAGYVHRIVAAGEVSGRLAEALAEAAAELEYENKIRTELRQALVYPALLVGFGVLAVVFIFLIVVPRFAVVFEGKFDKLPLLSYLVIATGLWFEQHLLFALAAGAGIALLTVQVLRRSRVRETALDLLSRLPLLHRWLGDVQRARWASVLARLLEARVPLIQSLELARSSLGAGDLHSTLAQVERDVRAGAALAAALDRSRFLPSTAMTLIRVGERSGNLAEMVRSIAAMYDELVRNRIRTALTIIEPAAIVLIGGVIGLIAVAIFLAITSINNVPGI